MAANLVFAPEAEVDTAEAYDWYERRRAGLGEDFLTALDACVEALHRNPRMNATVFETYRRGLLRRFPYAVIYGYSEETITVYAVFHTSRDPNKWRQRMP